MSHCPHSAGLLRLDPHPNPPEVIAALMPMPIYLKMYDFA